MIKVSSAVRNEFGLDINILLESNYVEKQARITLWAKITKPSSQTKGTSAESFDLLSVSRQCVTFQIIFSERNHKFVPTALYSVLPCTRQLND